MSRRYVAWSVAAALAVLMLAGWRLAAREKSDLAKGPRVVVLAAASTTDAMVQFAERYERETGVAVAISTGPSNGLARQIVAGAPADVYVSASPKWADLLVSKGLVARAMRGFLYNQLVLIVPSGNPANVRALGDLQSDSVERVALAGEGVPAGEYAEAALRHARLFESLRTAGKIVRGHDVRVTLGYVESGEVAAGLVYATDALVTDKVEIVGWLDPAWYPPIQYPAVLLQGARPEGRAFYEALVSNQKNESFAEHGFLIRSRDERAGG